VEIPQNRGQPLPDLHGVRDDFDEIEAYASQGLAMLRKVAVALIACAALCFSFFAYYRRQVWLSALILSCLVGLSR